MPQTTPFKSQLNPEVGSNRYAHKLVRSVVRKVSELESDWIQARNDVEEGNNRIDNLEYLIEKLRSTGVSVNEDDAINVFRYFCAARLYAISIEHSYRRGRVEHTANLEVPERELDSVTLHDLNHLAKHIVEKLDILRMTSNSGIDQFNGNRSGLTSRGNVPFMKVFANDSIQVYLRRGFELSNEKEKRFKRLVQNANDKISKYPMHVYVDGKRVSGYYESDTLQHVFPIPSLFTNFMLGKYITMIQVHRPNDIETRHTFEIDITDHHIECDPYTFHESLQKLASIAGCNSQILSGRTDHDYYQEDIIVSFFSDVIFDDKSIHMNSESGIGEQDCDTGKQKWQDMENWCNDAIKNIVASVLSSQDKSLSKTDLSSMMYLGFCFKTLIGSGYTDQNIVNGAKNVLLLALTRGLMNLSRENESSCEFMGFECTNELQHRGSSTGECTSEVDEHSSRGFKLWNIFSKYRWNRREEDTFSISSTYYEKHRDFKCANSKCITVRTKIPKMLLLLCGLGLSIVFGYGYGVGIHTSSTSRNWAEFWAGFTAVVSAVIGIIILSSKCLYKSWELTDMFHRLRRAQCMSELVSAVKGGRKEVVKIFCQLQNPDEVFSKWRSTAFTTNAKGEFEIDEEIYVSDLQDSGCVFGLDYYGKPIILDVLGRTRVLDFSTGALLFGDIHNLQPTTIMKIPIKDSIVGSWSYVGP